MKTVKALVFVFSLIKCHVKIGALYVSVSGWHYLPMMKRWWVSGVPRANTQLPKITVKLICAIERRFLPNA